METQGVETQDVEIKTCPRVRGVWDLRRGWCGECGVGSVVRVVWCGLRGAGCVVRVAWCGERGARCVVRVAWCGLRGAGSVVRVVKLLKLGE